MLASDVHAIMDEHQCPVHFISHSAGALVVRNALAHDPLLVQKLERAAPKCNIIQITPANGGSEYARFVSNMILCDITRFWKRIVPSFVLHRALQSLKMPQYKHEESALQQLVMKDPSFFVNNWWTLPQNAHLFALYATTMWRLPVISAPNDGVLTLQEQTMVPATIQYRQQLALNAHHSFILNYQEVRNYIVDILKE